MIQIATLKGLRCPQCGSEQLRVTGVKGALGTSLATGIAFGAIGNLVAGKNAAANTVTEPLQYKCNSCGNKFESLPLCAPPEEILSTPCSITFTRERSFVGSAVPQIVYLNGVKLGAVNNGASLTFPTGNRFNTLFVTDQYGVAFDSVYRFEALPGGMVSARFMRKFLNVSTMPPVPSPAITAPAEAPPAAAAPRTQEAAPPSQSALPVLFCTRCGNRLEDGALFCEKCGAKRFVP